MKLFIYPKVLMLAPSAQLVYLTNQTKTKSHQSLCLPHSSHEDLHLIIDHLPNLPYPSLPPLVSHDDPLHPLLLHLVDLPPHQQHHHYQVHC